MLASPCYILADAHLGVASTELERGMVGFLRSLAGRAGSLVVNGDLFDFWFEWRRVVPRGHFRILAAIADVVDAGIPVLMLGGNHDSWGGDVLTRDVGATYSAGAWDGVIAGWRAHVEHGDGLRPREDRVYRQLRRVLRSPLAIGAFRWIHPDVSSWLARGTSDASRARRSSDGGAGLRAVAQAYLGAHPDVELVVYGHSHRPTLERAPAGGVYANPGAWMDAPTYLEVTSERIALRRWRGSAESELLDVLERRAEKALP